MSAPRHEREVEQAQRSAASRDPFDEGSEAARARRLRSVGIAAALIAFVLLIFAVTLIRLTANAHHG